MGMIGVAAANILLSARNTDIKVYLMKIVNTNAGQKDRVLYSCKVE